MGQPDNKSLFPDSQSMGSFGSLPLSDVGPEPGVYDDDLELRTAEDEAADAAELENEA